LMYKVCAITQLNYKLNGKNWFENEKKNVIM
jgi:hypothetical protein